MRLRALALLCCLASPTLFAASKPREGPEVLVVSDVVDPASPSLRPTKENPVYYIFLGGTERTLGDPIAGEKMPDRTALLKEIVGALNAQGFVPTRVGGPRPQIAILYSYGTASLSTYDLEDTDTETGDTTTTTIAFNQREIRDLVGAFQAERHMLMMSEADRINEAARDLRLYIFLAAFDVEALARKEKKILWRTRISIDSRRRNLPDSMHVMLTSAAPHFATTTDRPTFIEDADRRHAEVRIGTPTVVEEGNAKDGPPAK